MNKLMDSCEGCKSRGTYMCTSPKDCIDGSLYKSNSLYSFDLDRFKIECCIKDKEPCIEVKGDYTVISHHISGLEWTEINCGELKGHNIDKGSNIHLKDVNKYYVSEDEVGYGFYILSGLVIIYFNLSTGQIAHKVYPRMDYIVK